MFSLVRQNRTNENEISEIKYSKYLNLNKENYDKNLEDQFLNDVLNNMKKTKEMNFKKQMQCFCKLYEVFSSNFGSEVLKNNTNIKNTISSRASILKKTILQNYKINLYECIALDIILDTFFSKNEIFIHNY